MVVAEVEVVIIVVVVVFIVFIVVVVVVIGRSGSYSDKISICRTCSCIIICSSGISNSCSIGGGWTLDPRVCMAYLVLCFNIAPILK